MNRVFHIEYAHHIVLLCFIMLITWYHHFWVDPHDDLPLFFRAVLTLRLRQNGCFLQTKFWNAFSSMKMFEFRLKFHWNLFPRVQSTILVQIMVCHLFGAKPLSEPLMTHVVNTYIYTSLNLNDLRSLGQLVIWPPQSQLEQLERLRSEDTPAASWLPIPLSHIGFQVKRRQSQNFKFLNFETGISRDTPSEVAW